MTTKTMRRKTPFQKEVVHTVLTFLGRRGIRLEFSRDKRSTDYKIVLWPSAFRRKYRYVDCNPEFGGSAKLLEFRVLLDWLDERGIKYQEEDVMIHYSFGGRAHLSGKKNALVITVKANP